MAICRDWLGTLWQASFKGVPFYIDKDDESGGRRIVVHEFPMRDDPFLEDLGEAPRTFDGTAYVASDFADAEATALVDVLVSEGPGLLVLPTHGPILCRCMSFSRDRSKDRHGYIGFKFKFTREGAAVALVSLPGLANAVSVAGDLLASVSAVAFSAAAFVLDVADFVISAGVAMIEFAAAAIDLIRTTVAVVATVDAIVRDAAADLLSLAPMLFNRLTGASGDFATMFFSMARDLAEGMDAVMAVRAFGSLFDQTEPLPYAPGASQFEIAATANANEVRRVIRAAALVAYAEATTRVEYQDRPQAISARADVAERFETEMAEARGELFVALQAVRNATVEYLSRAVLDLAPVVTVSANLSRPSLYWAWRLYQDPTRAGELVARNRVIHPSYMPTTFEALAR